MRISCLVVPAPCRAVYRTAWYVCKQVDRNAHGSLEELFPLFAMIYCSRAHLLLLHRVHCLWSLTSFFDIGNSAFSYAIQWILLLLVSTGHEIRYCDFSVNCFTPQPDIQRKLKKRNPAGLLWLLHDRLANILKGYGVMFVPYVLFFLSEWMLLGSHVGCYSCKVEGWMRRLTHVSCCRER